MAALTANRPIVQVDPQPGSYFKRRYPLALSMPVAVVNGPAGVPTVSLSGTQNPANLLGGPASFFAIQIAITTGGALGVSQFTWSLNGVPQASGVATAASVILGSTGLTATFAAGTYVQFTTYTFTPNFQRIFGGAIVCTNASGQLVDGTASTSLTVVGVCPREVTNSPLFSPQLLPQLATDVICGGTFPFASGTAGDQLSAANIGADVYLIDDQTVGLTNGGSTRQRAGWLSDYRTFPDPRGDSPAWAALYPAIVTMTANPSAP
jgi:hypothetical protein